MDKLAHPNVYNYLGFSFALIGALTLAVVPVLIKKLADQNVHYSVTIIFASYFGLPFSMILSLILIITGVEIKQPEMLSNTPTLIMQIIYSILSGLCGILAQILVNISVKTEEPYKVSMIRSADLLFTFLFQYLILNICPNVFSICGGLLIFLAALICFLYKPVEKMARKSSYSKETLVFYQIYFMPILKLNVLKIIFLK